MARPDQPFAFGTGRACRPGYDVARCGRWSVVHHRRTCGGAPLRRCGGPDAVAHLVSRFNHDGMAAVEPRHGGGPPTVYTSAERDRILAEARRPPDPVRDGTATWSLTTLQRALRRAPNGLQRVSVFTIWRVLREAGLTWQRDRSWCATGRVLRKSGTVTVTDPDTEPKKS